MSRLVRSLAFVLLASFAVAACAPAAPSPASKTAPTQAPAAQGTQAPATPATQPPAAAAKPTDAAAPAAAGEATIALANDVECWNPIEGPCGASPKYHDLVMERLVVWDNDIKLAPGLATSWKIVNDLTWEFKLRENVKFTNGEPFDADAVVYMFDAALNPKGRDAPPTTVGSYRLVSRIEVVDKYTVRFHTKEPFPLLVNYMAFEPRAVPPKYYAEVGKDEFGKKPIGTGPYKLLEWVKDNRFVLEANPDYWGEKPAIRRLVFRPIPEESTRLAEVLAGSVDIAEKISPDQIGSLQRSQSAREVTVPTLRTLTVNLRPEDRVQSLPLREAFEYATNVDVIIKEVINGLGDKLARGNPVTKYEFGYDESIPEWPYDPDKARQKLKEANYDGREIKMFYPQGEVSGVDRVAEALQAQWTKVGLNVSIQMQEYGLWRKNWTAREVPGDIYLATGSAKGMDSDARFVPSVRCYQPDKGLGRVSFACDQKIDAILDQATTMMDQDKRRELYAQAWNLHRDTAHYVALYSPRDLLGVSRKVEWQPDVEGLWSTLARAKKGS
jgi:peptide/nickel transport system substrate-binding protein